MKNFRRLNLPFYPLIENFVFPEPKLHGWDIYLYEPHKLVNADCINFFSEIGLELFNCHLFRGPKGSACHIHIDGGLYEWQLQTYAINWIIGSTASEMVWYDAVTPGKVSNTHVGTPYKTFSLDEVTVIEKLSIDTNNNGPFLVRTDIPHRVINNDLLNDRWCISLRTKKTLGNWENIVDFYKPYIND